jgi:hypothetical protein
MEGLKRFIVTPTFFQHSDTSRAQRGASRKLNFIIAIVPIHPRLQSGAFSAPAGKKKSL